MQNISRGFTHKKKKEMQRERERHTRTQTKAEKIRERKTRSLPSSSIVAVLKFFTLDYIHEEYSFIVAKLSHEKEHHLCPMIHHY